MQLTSGTMIQANDKSVLDFNEFSHWLSMKPSDQAIGTPRCSGKCPIANYLISLGFTHVNVTQNYAAWFDGRNHQQSLDLYFLKFVKYIDFFKEPVSAGVALEAAKFVQDLLDGGLERDANIIFS